MSRELVNCISGQAEMDRGKSIATVQAHKAQLGHLCPLENLG